MRLMLLALLGVIGRALFRGRQLPANRPALFRGRGAVVCLGASTVQGNVSYNFVDELARRLPDRTFVNAGINGDTTEGMLQRLDRTVPNGTSAVILQPGGNDRRKGSPDRTSEIQSRLKARGIPVIMIANGTFWGLPHQPDGQHLTPEGYHMLAEHVASQVAGVIGR